jgi:hypothetical protein
MSKLKISTQITALVGAMLLLLILVGGMGLYGLANGATATGVMYDHGVMEIDAMGKIRYRD